MLFRSLKTLSAAVALAALGSSCNQLIKMTDESYYEKMDVKSGADHLKIIFSHNINGETHPCGCRKFPLGGLPQAAGYLHEARKSAPVVYVDSGDMLFASPAAPQSMLDSLKFTADKLAQAQKMQGLALFTPGDQDFALGAQYLAELSKSAGFDFLITNMKESSPLKYRKSAMVEAGDVKVVFLGIIDPSLLPGEAPALFADPVEALRKELAKIKKQVKNQEGLTLALLSHGGMDFDKKIAKLFPELDWIIGSHSQAFLKSPETVGDVKIVQALSRNHYLGEIQIPFNPKKEASYTLAPMSEGMEKKDPNNKLIPWLAAYKSELDAIQQKEQKRFMAESFSENNGAGHSKLKTYISCSECHKEQTEFWQKTPHSLAWQTLEKAQAANNPQCIGCHSLGFQSPQGFASSADIVQGQGLDEKKLALYLEEVKSVFRGMKSVRELSSEKRKELSGVWMKTDAKFGIESNFANVQCLHCHNQDPEHPFDMGDAPKQKDYAQSCLQCHTADQSPDWYHKGENGLATTPNKKYVGEKIKQMACPRM